MPVERALPTEEARDLLALAHELAVKELAPRAAEYEARSEFPADVVHTIARAGMLGLPYPEELGGGGQPYGVYLQVLEELAAGWAAVALTVSVHTLACFPLATFGAPALRDQMLPEMLAGDRLGAYCLSEAHAGSDAAALATRAVREDDTYLVNGTKAWVTCAGRADLYNVFVRTGDAGPRGISLLLADADTPGLHVQRPERKMGLRSSPTAAVSFEEARVPASRLVGAEGEGFRAPMAALDGGRLGVAAMATGVAQAALDHAIGYTRQRRQFGRPVIEFQGLGFLLADMATGVEAARALYLEAARRRDAGQPYSRLASMAKLFATDTAMRVTTDAVQALGGAGYVEDHPVERFMREVKVMQIFEGTNQIQRVVISRSLAAE